MRYWISWEQPTQDPRPLKYPPLPEVLACWESGIGAGHFTMCAVVDAPDESGAQAKVRVHWPEATKWRFCTPMPDWRPTDRFALPAWSPLAAEFAAAAAAAEGRT